MWKNDLNAHAFQTNKQTNKQTTKQKSDVAQNLIDFLFSYFDCQRASP